jgi:putative transposase
MARRKHYPSDLTDAEWELVAPWLEPDQQGKRGRRRTVPRREVVDAILYVPRTGCQWRYLPGEFPNWSTVYDYFSRWTDDGTWERLNDQLRREPRVQIGRDAEPSAACLDSQSAKTAEKGAIAATTLARR